MGTSQEVPRNIDVTMLQSQATPQHAAMPPPTHEPQATLADSLGDDDENIAPLENTPAWIACMKRQSTDDLSLGMLSPSPAPRPAECAAGPDSIPTETIPYAHPAPSPATTHTPIPTEPAPPTPPTTPAAPMPARPTPALEPAHTTGDIGASTTASDVGTPEQLKNFWSKFKRVPQQAVSPAPPLPTASSPSVVVVLDTPSPQPVNTSEGGDAVATGPAESAMPAAAEHPSPVPSSTPEGPAPPHAVVSASPEPAAPAPSLAESPPLDGNTAAATPIREVATLGTPLTATSPPPDIPPTEPDTTTPAPASAGNGTPVAKAPPMQPPAPAQTAARETEDSVKEERARWGRFTRRSQSKKAPPEIALKFRQAQAAAWLAQSKF